jgi:hypothetical protein
LKEIALLALVNGSERSEKESANVRREMVSDLVLRPRIAEDYRLALYALERSKRNRVRTL